ncbi:MAG: cellulase family glycosylhydrolase [Leptospira sp.]|nr:cellulase family glycosylhydrolase [Leptospira sp.]
MKKLQIHGNWFIEEKSGRRILLRGINLGGDTKVPFPRGGTQYQDDFKNHREVSFVGRPFPLEEADEHFTRLKNWGFNCLRLLTTWEAVEHKGPGEYDEHYLDYFTEINRLAGEYGFYVFIDFHQDVWSRMTGGDGAPGWTLEKIGMDISKIASSDSAKVMQSSYDYKRLGIRQEENYPTMCWSQNYRYPANAIMWTLFFGGRDFAPKFMIDGQNVQDYLRGHYLDSMREIAKRVRNMDHVLGFDSLNEPSRGWIGKRMVNRGLVNSPEHPNQPGLAWSPIDGLFASFGYSVELPFLELSLIKGGFVPKKNVLINPEKVTLWSEDSLGDPFRLEGAWELKDDMPFVLRDDFFCKVGDREVDFDRDYMIPFIHLVHENITSVREDWMVFAEREAMESVLSPDFKIDLPKNSVNASHWYDFTTLFFKKFNYPITVDPLLKKPVVGRKNIQKMYERQLTGLKNASIKQNCPTLIGEFGIPFDLQSGKAYREWKKGNRNPSIWKKHILALDIMYNAIDHLQLHSTIWNYTAGNSNDLMIGDQWNQEDLSLYSADQKFLDDLSVCHLYGGGGRAIEGFSRPYPVKTAGAIVEYRFDSGKKEFYLEYKVSENDLEYSTEVFIPDIHYPGGIKIEILQGDLKLERNAGTVLIQSLKPGLVQIRITS